MMCSQVLCVHSNFCVKSSSEALHEGVEATYHRLLKKKAREHMAAARSAYPYVQ